MRIVLIIALLLSNGLSYGQNLDKLGTKDAVTVSGGLSFNTVTYFQKGLLFPSREPFTWFASGNVNISILDVALPFTYTYSNQGGKFTQPFNRAALHPTYKWVKTHIGTTSMSFSPYTLSGHLFLGGGVELTPGNWNIQLMSGRLNKTVAYDPIEDNLNNIAYRRFGYGLKVAYTDKGYMGAITIFKAKDNENTLPFVPLNTNIKPQDNLVMSLAGTAKLTKSLFLEAEYALSGLTQNTFAINDLGDESKSILHGLINGNETTDYFQAYNASIRYALKFMNISFKFEHIDPGYKTLGGYYFNNDLENYTLAPSFSLFKKKMTLALNTGYQRNNLSSEEAATTNRWIGSINATFVPNKKIVLTGNYSNFSTFTQNRPVTDPFYFTAADTLNFYQLTQAASSMVSYNFGNDDIKNSLQFLYNYQESTSLTGNISNAGAFGVNVATTSIGIPAQTHMGNVGYTSQLVDQKLGITVAGNVNHTRILDQKSVFFGPTLNLQKSLWDKKASVSLGTTYNRQYQNQFLTSNILNHRVSFSLNPKLNNEKLGTVALSANANWMQRFALDPTTINISEVNIFINLNYSF